MFWGTGALPPAVCKKESVEGVAVIAPPPPPPVTVKVTFANLTALFEPIWRVPLYVAGEDKTEGSALTVSVVGVLPVPGETLSHWGVERPVAEKVSAPSDEVSWTLRVWAGPPRTPCRLIVDGL